MFIILSSCVKENENNGNYSNMAPKIDSLIMSSDLTTKEDINVICYSTFPYTSCFSENFNINIENNIIQVENYHFMGGYAGFCNSVDTIPLGNLNEGNYVLYYYLNYKTEMESTYTLADIDTILFVVSSKTKPKK